MRFNSKILVGLAIIGRMPATALWKARKRMSELSGYGINLNNPDLLHPPFRWAEVFVILAQSSSNPSLHDLMVSSKSGRLLKQIDRF